MDAGGGRAGENIRDYMESVRAHRVVLDPSVMVALMSMVVLEGWQWRLDPEVSIAAALKSTMGDGVFGYVGRFNQWLSGMKEQFFGPTDGMRKLE
jgi:aarF domain-containing kinase|tara:strand:- start:1547 stop:1831 length:285 start_codon:yes stop_codon:yes gene_type:complete